jgi:hypothetical protein
LLGERQAKVLLWGDETDGGTTGTERPSQCVRDVNGPLGASPDRARVATVVVALLVGVALLPASLYVVPRTGRDEAWRAPHGGRARRGVGHWRPLTEVPTAQHGDSATSTGRSRTTTSTGSAREATASWRRRTSSATRRTTELRPAATGRVWPARVASGVGAVVLPVAEFVLEVATLLVPVAALAVGGLACAVHAATVALKTVRESR